MSKKSISKKYQLIVPIEGKKTVTLGTVTRAVMKSAAKKELESERNGVLLQAFAGLSDAELNLLSGPDFYALDKKIDAQLVPLKVENVERIPLSQPLELANGESIQFVTRNMVTYKDIVDSERLGTSGALNQDDFLIARLFDLEVAQVDSLCAQDFVTLRQVYADFLSGTV